LPLDTTQCDIAAASRLSVYQFVTLRYYDHDISWNSLTIIPRLSAIGLALWQCCAAGEMQLYRWPSRDDIRQCVLRHLLHRQLHLRPQLVIRCSRGQFR